MATGSELLRELCLMVQGNLKTRKGPAVEKIFPERKGEILPSTFFIAFE